MRGARAADSWPTQMAPTLPAVPPCRHQLNEGLRGRTQGYGPEALLQRVCLNTLTAARAGLGHLQGSRESQNIQVESMESSFPAPDAEKVQ